MARTDYNSVYIHVQFHILVWDGLQVYFSYP